MNKLIRDDLEDLLGGATLYSALWIAALAVVAGTLGLALTILWLNQDG